MASDRNSAAERLNERLAEARDGALLQDEKVIAEEAGDQGQAIVLTESRIIVLKVGLAATGSVNGQRMSSFEKDRITAVRLRKGPMGAAIEVCASEQPDAAPEARRSDNVIVFSDPGKEKKCEALVEEIGSTLGTPIERVESGSTASTALRTEMPDSVQPAERGVLESEQPAAQETQRISTPREPTSLAEEIYAEIAGPREPEVSETTAEAVPETMPDSSADSARTAASEPPAPAAEHVTAFIEETIEPDEHLEFGPNPHLPRPVRRRRASSVRGLALVAGLAALVIVGMAVTGPSTQPPQSPEAVVETSSLTLNPKAMSAQLKEIDSYRGRVTTILQSCDADVQAFKAALETGGREALSGIQATRVDDAWRALTKIEAPAGLASARNKLTSGMFTLKADMAETLSRAQTGGAVDTSQAARKVAAAEKTIAAGLAEVDRMRAELERRLAAARKNGPGS